MSDFVKVNLIGTKEEKDVFMDAIYDVDESYCHGVAANTKAILRFTKVDGVATIVLDKIILECAKTAILFDDIEVSLKKAFSAQIDTEFSEGDSFDLGGWGNIIEGAYLELKKR
jgi:hypothetical protein